MSASRLFTFAGLGLVLAALGLAAVGELRIALAVLGLVVVAGIALVITALTR